MENVKCKNVTTDITDCYFKKNKELFSWYSVIDETTEENEYLMPCLKNTEVRVNYCPTCGAYVRQATFKK